MKYAKLKLFFKIKFMYYNKFECKTLENKLFHTFSVLHPSLI